MKNKILLTSILIITSTLLFISCDAAGAGSETSDISRMNILNAQSLFIADGNNDSSRSTTSNTLFKITEDGFVEEVSYYDENDNPYSQTNNPVAIYNINNDLIMILFGYDAEYPNTGYIVRKSDGAVYEMPDAYLPINNGNDKNKENVIVSGNYAFYLSGSYSSNSYFPQLSRLYIGNPNSMSVSKSSPDNEYVHYFTVDDNENAAFLSTNNDHSVYNYRISKSDSGYLNFSDGHYMETRFWKGLDGSLYHTNGTDYSQSDIIVKIYRYSDNQNVLHKEISHSSDVYYGWDDFGEFPLNVSGYQYFTKKSGTLTEVYNPVTGMDLKKYDFSNIINDIVLSKTSDTHLYLAGRNNGNSVLIRVTPGSTSATSILSSDYEITQLSVSADNNIEFSALRLSDGRNVIGRIENAHQVSSPSNPILIEESVGNEIHSLVKIN